MSDSEAEHSTCKKCGREGPKDLFFNRKKKQVTCNDCLDKAKNIKVSNANDKVGHLEQRITELESQLEHEIESKKYYEKQFRLIAESYTKACLDTTVIGRLEKLVDLMTLKSE
jgi:phosphatidate phosphatase PAH1